MRLESYEESAMAEQEVQFANIGRMRKKRKQRNRMFMTFSLTGCIILLLVIVCLAVSMWQRAGQVKDTMAGMEPVTYTQQELEERVLEAEQRALEQVKQSVQAKEEEILGGIKQNLQDGLSVVETLRAYYPNDLVLASSGQYHFVPIKESLKQNDYDISCLNILESGEYQYVENGQILSYKGIDVSKHQGEIDWQKVAADGVEFAFVRVALRGYGTGKLVEDEMFEENIKGALNAGIKVGVYIYSQAITEEELLEEANFVLERIAPYKIECPVVYDVEMVAGEDGRMNNLSAEERTKLAALFCQTIENAGYQSMIYHNMEMGVLKIHLEQLEEYDKWFAYYNPNFYYPYAYDVWQYSEKGRIDGIKGDVDLNISFVPLWEE